MDAVKFLREQHRMCEFYKCCEGCHLAELAGKNSCTKVDYECQVKVVEEWAKEHPAKTRASEFLKQYPKALVDMIDKLPRIMPCAIDTSVKEKLCKCDFSCSECRKKYWTEEIE